MFSDIQQFCNSCLQCTSVSGTGPGVGRPPLQPIPVLKPFHLVGVSDIMDLPKTELGNKHVLVFQDFPSKWPMVFPIPDQKTTRDVDILVNQIVPLFGVPEGLLSDRGTNLLSFLSIRMCAIGSSLYSNRGSIVTSAAPRSLSPSRGYYTVKKPYSTHSI